MMLVSTEYFDDFESNWFIVDSSSSKIKQHGASNEQKSFTFSKSGGNRVISWAIAGNQFRLETFGVQSDLTLELLGSTNTIRANKPAGPDLFTFRGRNCFLIVRSEQLQFFDYSLTKNLRIVRFTEQPDSASIRNVSQLSITSRQRFNARTAQLDSNVLVYPRLGQYSGILQEIRLANGPDKIGITKIRSLSSEEILGIGDCHVVFFPAPKTIRLASRKSR